MEVRVGNSASTHENFHIPLTWTLYWKRAPGWKAVDKSCTPNYRGMSDCSTNFLVLNAPKNVKTIWSLQFEYIVSRLNFLKFQSAKFRTWIVVAFFYKNTSFILKNNLNRLHVLSDNRKNCLSKSHSSIFFHTTRYKYSSIVNRDFCHQPSRINVPFSVDSYLLH